jgi:3-hydroxyisobutyrate dehydrogenase-like beta-hydroxyacid dehydrogenase
MDTPIHAHVGFIGLGAMGLPMAMNVKERLAPTYQLHVHDINPTAVATAVEQGAVSHSTPNSVASACDVVITMVPHDAVLEKVVHDTETGLLADDGNRTAFANDGSGTKIHIGCSTVHPYTSRKMATTHQYVGAPVFARADGVALRQASLVVGATDQSLIDKVRPVLDAMAAQVFIFSDPHRPDAGAGNVVKLCGNFLIASTIQASAEACALAESQGVDRVAVMDMLSSTIFDCLIYRGYGRRVAHRQHVPGQELVGPGFGLALGCKDVRLAREVAQQGGQPLPLADLLYERWQTSVDRGRSHLDWSAVALLTAEDAGKDVTQWLGPDAVLPSKTETTETTTTNHYNNTSTSGPAALDFRDIHQHPPAASEQFTPMPSDPSWDAHKVYFNERPQEEKDRGDGFDEIWKQSDEDKVAIEQHYDPSKQSTPNSELDPLGWPVVPLELQSDTVVSTTVGYNDGDQDQDDLNLLRVQKSDEDNKTTRIEQYHTTGVDDESSGESQSEDDNDDEDGDEDVAYQGYIDSD